MDMINRMTEGGVKERLGRAFGGAPETDLKEVLRILKRRKWVIIATVIGLTAVMTAGVFAITPRYEASLEIVFDAKTSNMIDFEAAFTGEPQDEAALLSEIEVIGSRKLASRVIDKLGLGDVPEFNKSLRAENRVVSFFRALAEDWLPESSRRPVAGSEVRSAYAERLTADQRASLEKERIVDAFLGNVEARHKGRSRVVEVTFTSEDPIAAADIANTLADLYLVERLEGRFENVRRASDWLANRVATLRDTLEISEKKVEEYRRTHGLLKGEKDATLLGEQVSALNAQLSQAKLTRTEVEARLAQVTQVVSGTSGVSSLVEVLENPLIQRLSEQEAALVRKEAELSGQYGPEHPLMLNVKAEKAQFRERIDAEVSKIVASLANDVEVAQRREAALQSDLNRMEGQLAEANTAQVGLHSLEREAEANRVMLERFRTNFLETRAQEDAESQIPDARIISPAAIPEDPAFPKKKLMIGGGLIGSILIGLLLAFTIEQLDPGFRSAEQVERQLGVSVIALLPMVGRMRLGRNTMAEYVFQNPDSAFADAIRSILASMILISSKDEPRSVVVSSSEPSEGKTTVSICLALMRAQAGRRVLLVDTDFRRAGVAKAMGLSKTPGLMELMTGRAEMADVVHRHADTGVDVIVSGNYTQTGFDLLSSQKMKDLMAGWQQSYDLVVIDTAPLLVMSETRLICNLADAAVLVVRWGKTRREVVNYALNMIADTSSQLCGVALSMVDTRRHASYGYGDSGYYYGKAKKYYQE